jgi:DNA-binding IclR family transcriptional regulator
LDDEEDEIGWRCLGAPVFGGTGEVIAAISLSGTTTQIVEGNATSLVEQLKRSAALISEHIGFVPKRSFGN